MGSFMYCNTYIKDKLTQQKEFEKDAMLRVVPELLSSQNEYFNIKNCTFVMEAYKAGSCRQAMFTDLKIHNSFTLENSFFLTTKDKKKAEK
jgi:predicted nucleic-acid-binding protein